MKHNLLGEVPALSLWQELVLAVKHSVFVGYRGMVPVYVVECSVHGRFLDTPHGYRGYFQCAPCLAELQAKKQKNPQIINLGFCPRCKDVIQPEHTEGYASRAVDGVLFCTLCAWHLEGDSAERVKWVQYAKAEVSK